MTHRGLGWLTRSAVGVIAGGVVLAGCGNPGAASLVVSTGHTAAETRPVTRTAVDVNPNSAVAVSVTTPAATTSVANPAPRGTTAATAPAAAPAPAPASDDGECVIKGNISSSGERIYHVPGQQNYDDTVITLSKGERWFCTETDALAAGWRKAKR